MAISLAELEKQAQLLSADDRARLAEMFLESLQGTRSPDVEAAWKREIEERVAAFDRGDLLTFPAEEVFAEERRIAR